MFWSFETKQGVDCDLQIQCILLVFVLVFYYHKTIIGKPHHPYRGGACLQTRWILWARLLQWLTVLLGAHPGYMDPEKGSVRLDNLFPSYIFFNECKDPLSINILRLTILLVAQPGLKFWNASLLFGPNREIRIPWLVGPLPLTIRVFITLKKFPETCDL